MKCKDYDSIYRAISFTATMMCVNCAPGRQRDLHDGHDESCGAEMRLRVGFRLDLREDLFRARRALYPDGMRSDFGGMASDHRSCSIKMKSPISESLSRNYFRKFLTFHEAPIAGAFVNAVWALTLLRVHKTVHGW